ncbi:MAG TPA: hypothetical protein H9724_00840 [Candidatus Gemmiger avistercoris]|uniref:Uncharacterized protein n=1 Tax=Candidatus Gemmiger avistercoris TaxID=2838606 RepID=A0A9D2FIS1_9FIRM|nr:hypothetical protein [uncultured Subdoligranulum sp.]HIZ61307.1 hypothetical protein [Candidatus Gemmiger avistercoris]
MDAVAQVHPVGHEVDPVAELAQAEGEIHPHVAAAADGAQVDAGRLLQQFHRAVHRRGLQRQPHPRQGFLLHPQHRVDDLGGRGVGREGEVGVRQGFAAGGRRRAEQHWYKKVIETNGGDLG